MMNEKIFANEILLDEELDNISGGAPTKIQMASERFSNPYESLAKGVANAINGVLMLIFDKKN